MTRVSDNFLLFSRVLSLAAAIHRNHLYICGEILCVILLVLLYDII